MYFWKVDQLVSDFKNDRVSEEEKVKYYLLFCVSIVTVSDPISYNVNKLYTDIDCYNLIISLLVTIFGTLYLFKINRAGDNKNFIDRAICLGLPVIIRLLPLLFFIIFMIGVIEKTTSVSLFTHEGDHNSSYTTPFEVFLNSVLTIFYYYKLGTYVAEVSSSGKLK